MDCFYCRFSFTVTCMDTVENIMCSCTATTPPRWRQTMALVPPRLISEKGSSLGSCLREYVLIVYILLKYAMDSSLWNSALYTIIHNLWNSYQSMFYNSDDLWLGLSALKICILYLNGKRIDDIWHWNILHTHNNSGFLFSLQTSFPFLPVNSKSKDAKSPQVAWLCGARCGSSTASHWRPHLAEPFSTGKEQGSILREKFQL